MTKTAITILTALLFAAHAADISAGQDTLERPNFVVIVVDDLGLNEVSSFLGKHYQTPAIDRLAQEGTRFTHAIVNPICSPTRGVLVTGRYGYNTGIISNVGNVRGGLRMSLPDDIPTVANRLANHGYDTVIMGKWHLHWKNASHPLDVQHKGFTKSFVYVGETAPSSEASDAEASDESGGKLPSQVDQVFWKDGKNLGQVKGYSTEVLTDQAIEYLKTQASQPFLLWMTYFAVHNPFEASES